MHNSSFRIRTPRDFLYEMIVPQHDDFIRNNGSSRHALLTIILVNHMYEWVHRRKFNIDAFRKTYPNESNMAEVFELARNIANGTKHFEPRANTVVQAGFSSEFSDEFARPLNVEFPDGKQESVDIFLRQMVEFWRREEKRGTLA